MYIGERTRAARASTVASAMFATVTSASGRGAISASSSHASSSTPFRAALSRVASMASGSWSKARTGEKSRRRAAIETTPEPEPRSARLPGGSESRSSRHRRVVGCAPVPKARPGSMTTGRERGSGFSQGGPTQSRPTRIGRWKRRHASSQPPATSSERPGPNTCQSRSSPPAFVYAASSTPSPTSCGDPAKQRLAQRNADRSRSKNPSSRP
jgi:hypothetical protein